jgi:hypothetical protein
MTVTTLVTMSFTGGRSILISRQIGSVHAFSPSKAHSHFRTVTRFWDGPFLLLEPMQIAFGCCYQEMPKLPFRLLLRRLRVSHRLPMQLLLLVAVASVDVTVTATRAVSTALQLVPLPAPLTYCLPETEGTFLM